MKRLPKVLFVDDDVKILGMFEEFFSYSSSPKIECSTCSEPQNVSDIVLNGGWVFSKIRTCSKDILD